MASFPSGPHWKKKKKGKISNMKCAKGIRNYLVDKFLFQNKNKRPQVRQKCSRSLKYLKSLFKSQEAGKFTLSLSMSRRTCCFCHSCHCPSPSLQWMNNKMTWIVLPKYNQHHWNNRIACSDTKYLRITWFKEEKQNKTKMTGVQVMTGIWGNPQNSICYIKSAWDIQVQRRTTAKASGAACHALYWKAQG